MKVDEPVTVKAEEQEEKESHNVSAETVPEVKSGPEEEQIKDSSEHHNMETESVSDLIIFVYSMNSLLAIPFWTRVAYLLMSELFL